MFLHLKYIILPSYSVSFSVSGLLSADCGMVSPLVSVPGPGWASFVLEFVQTSWWEGLMPAH